MTDNKKTDEEQPMDAAPTPAVTDKGDIGLSVVSKQYDRGNKGYLDETEKKLRALDTNNDGKLDLNEIYVLMQEFQKEQQKSLTLKWVVIALSVFAVLLCLANIGTSFAAATLAKDTRSTPEFVLVDKSTGELLGTAAVNEIVDLDVGDGTETLPDPEYVNGTDIDGALEVVNGTVRHRFLSDATLGGTNKNPTISQNKVDRLEKIICKNWDGIQNYDCNKQMTCKFGADSFTISACNGNKRLKLYPSPVPPKCKNVNNNGKASKLIFQYIASPDGQIFFHCNGRSQQSCSVTGINCS